MGSLCEYIISTQKTINIPNGVNIILYPHVLRAQFQIFGYYAKIQTIITKKNTMSRVRENPIKCVILLW